MRFVLIAFVAIFIVFAPQSDRDADKTGSSDRGDKQPWQFRNCCSDQNRDTHLGHADQYGRSAVTGRQHARRIEQLVAHDFGEKNGAKCCEEDYEQMIDSSENTSAHSKTRGRASQSDQSASRLCGSTVRKAFGFPVPALL